MAEGVGEHLGCGGELVLDLDSLRAELVEGEGVVGVPIMNCLGCGAVEVPERQRVVNPGEVEN